MRSPVADFAAVPVTHIAPRWPAWTTTGPRRRAHDSMPHPSLMLLGLAVVGISACSPSAGDPGTPTAATGADSTAAGEVAARGTTATGTEGGRSSLGVDTGPVDATASVGIEGASGTSAQLAPPASLPEAPQQGPIVGGSKVTYLVWEARERPRVEDEAGLAEGKKMALPPLTTRWIEASPSGFSELGKRDGLWIATPATVFQLLATPAKFKTEICPDWEGEGEGAGVAATTTHTAFKLTLKGGDGSVQTVLKAAKYDEHEAMGSFEEAFDPSAGIGPALFVIRNEATYACGAHGDYVSSTIGWNVELGLALTVPSDSETMTLVSSHGARVAAIFKERDPDMYPDSADDPSGSGLTISTFLPWIEGSKLRVDLLFSGEACYACSDGLWSAYTQSTLLAAELLPEALRPYERVPAPVAAAVGPRPSLAQAKDPSLRAGFGWSTVPISGGGRDAVVKAFTPVAAP